MIQGFAILMAVTLAVFLGVHLSLLGSLLASPPHLRGLIALAVPPLAPYWGWQTGLKTRVYVWATSLALYAGGIAVLARA